MSDPTHYGVVAPVLLRMGWSPIPLHPVTKAPAIKWSGRNALLPSFGRIAWEANHFFHHSCGIAVPPGWLFLDLDITDLSTQREVVAAARRSFGTPVMVRVGRYPKLMLAFRAASEVRSFKAHPVEGFSGTGQIAAFGIHPVTGQPYQWLGGISPLTIRADALCP